MDEEEVFDADEIEFHGFIRTHVVCFLIFLLFYAISFSIIQYFKTRTDSDDELYSGDEDFFVYRISIWMCAFSLAISIGAVTLLPFSVMGSEVLHTYPDNYYLKWLNWSLINSLWNYVFLLSNVSLFFLLPFAYFFIESQGFSFHHRPKPFLARVYETICVCALVIVILVSLAHVFYSLFLSERLSVNFSFFNFSSLSVPLIYSFVSLAGVVLLLLSVPLGFAKMLDELSTMMADSQIETQLTKCSNGSVIDESGDSETVAADCAEALPLRSSNSLLARCKKCISCVKYPALGAVLVLLTGISVTIVFTNTLQLLFGFRALPEYVQYMEVHSRHAFGVTGAVLEGLIIMYVMLSALVGSYSMPLLKRMRPRRGSTSLTCVIANCTTILLLSSALPVLARTLGITSFDLLGAYGRLNWISNFSLVWSYNVAFTAASTFLILNRALSQPLKRAILSRIHNSFKRERNTKKSK